MIGPHTISTDAIPPHQRFEYWADEIIPVYMPMRISSRERDTASFQAHMSVAGGPSCALFRAASSIFELKYRPAMFDVGGLADHYSHVLVFVQSDAADQTTLISQGRHASDLRAGDCALVDLRQEFSGTIAGGGSRLYVCLSEQLVDAWIAPSARRVADRLGSARGWCRLLSSYLDGLAAMLAENAGTEQLSGKASLQIGEHIASLLSMTVEERYGSAPSGYGPENGRRHRLVQAMRAWIRDHHADPGLSADDLARAFNVSVRQVHRLIAGYSSSTQTFLQWLHGYRLEAAEHMLADRQYAHLTIADIAYACGYADPNSFTRAFRVYRNTTPSTIRRAYDSGRQEHP